MKHYTKDYDLCVGGLEDKYTDGDDDGEHPGYTKRLWREDVKCQQTLASYWQWVHFKLQCEMEDLDKTNPHTQWEKEMKL